MGIASKRAAGVLIPLFSLRTKRDWGIGEIPDLKDFSDWLADAGHSLLQLLPVNEVSPGENSPYSSLSAFALDPIYIAMSEVEDFQQLGGAEAMAGGLRAELERVRAAARVDYLAVRQLKRHALQAAFERFRQHEYAEGSRRAKAFQSFIEEHSWWLHDYALFRALHDRYQCHWETWAAPLRERQPAVLEQQKHELAGEILFYEYVQWQAESQWQAARRAAAHCGVRLKGDLPFMVSGHSADVWRHQHELKLDASVGAPPDAFSANGQNWGLPAYNWEVMAGNDFAWLRSRAARAAQLFDFYRVDHLVGFYRTYTIPKDGSRPYFSPGEEAGQRELGERLMGVFKSAGAEVMAEDLGTVPDFVRHSLAEQGIPGYKVLRWEREWHTPGQPFRDPAAYPELSAAGLEHARHRNAGGLVGRHRRRRTPPGLQDSGAAGNQPRTGPLHPRGTPGTAGSALRLRVALRDRAHSGCVRNAPPHQSSGHDKTGELDLSPAHEYFGIGHGPAGPPGDRPHGRLRPSPRPADLRRGQELDLTTKTPRRQRAQRIEPCVLCALRVLVVSRRCVRRGRSLRLQVLRQKLVDLGP